MTKAEIGTAVRRGEAGYEQARRRALWNELKPERFPELIVSPGSPEQAAAAVRQAREQGLRVAIRGLGHSWCGSPLREGGMLIDLSGLRALTVDSEARTASIGPGIESRQLAAALGAHGLAFPVGHCGPVGMSGFLLAGGLGWNSGAWGPACFSVRACELVTARGELVRADEREHPELYWAARGAGPGFPGLVTRFELALQPLPRAITTSTLLYPLDRLGEAAPWAVETAAALPASVELTLLLSSAPPGTPLEGQPALFVTATAFADSEDEARESLAPLEPHPLPERALVLQALEPTPFEALFGALGAFWPERHRYAADTIWTNEDAAAALARLRQPLAAAPSPKSLALAVMPPAGRPPPDAAFSMVDRTFLACYAVWEDARDDEGNLRWLRETIGALEPIASGHYVAESDLAAGPTRAVRSFSPAAWERLRALRAQRDPEGVFHDFLGVDSARQQ